MAALACWRSYSSGGLLYFAFAYMRRRQQPAPASPYGYAPPQEVETPSWQSASRDTATATMAATESDLERGIRHIQQMDSAFDPVRFTDTASEVFFNIQSAWMARDMRPVRHLMTPEMYEQMSKECERLRMDGASTASEHCRTLHSGDRSLAREWPGFRHRALPGHSAGLYSRREQ